ncbi:hypothetical protein, partial [Cetobacterium sp.]|uniref:hypothetical protein n=1 Tax=Cetobacterium sp. TaxID=2071632 RepID=UPI003F358F7E
MTYEPGDVVVYTLSLKNISGGVADEVIVKDDILSVVTELAGGGIGPAFSTWTVTLDKSLAAKVNGQTFPLVDKGIDVKVDLGPDKYVNFIISATVDAKAIGTISPNIAIINGEDKPTPPIPPKVPTAPVLTKKILVEADKLDKSEYTAGGTIVYEVVVTNPNEKLWLNDVNILDSISAITATDLAGNIVAAFKPNWTIAMANLKPATIFTVGGYPKTNVNLNETMDLAPGDAVTFKITAVVKDNVVGKILNATSGTYKKNKTETPTPLGPVTVESETKLGTAKITKTPFEEFYSPNGNIGFDITIENTSKDYLIDNLKLTDIISSIKALKIAGGTETEAFKTAATTKTGWTITYQVVGDTVNTNATAIPVTGDIDAVNLDIGKSTKIIIQIRGIAEAGIYGNIINTASYVYPDENPDNKVIATIKPKDPIIELEKTVIPLEYGPTDSVIYTLQLKNIGTGAAIGVELKDEIGKIPTTLAGIPETGVAFTSWSRESIILPETSSIEGLETLVGDTYKATLNIAPGDIVKITLKGNLNPNSYGDIKNTAYAKYKNAQGGEVNLSEEVIIKPKPSKLFLLKEVNKTTYEDKDILIFKVTLRNGGEGWANDVIIEDKISEILDENTAKAFKSWEIKINKSKPESLITTNTATPVEVTEIAKGTTDLNVIVDIAPLSQVEFVITAELNENIGSTLTNTVTSPNIEPKPEHTVTVEPIKGNVSVVKKVKELKYTPGGKLNYTIEVKNDAKILVKDVIIKDILKDVQVTTNLEKTIGAFTSWKVLSVSTSLTTPVTSIAPAIGTSVTVDDVVIKTNLKPSEVITINIEADVTLGSSIDGVPTGIITNVANVLYDEQNIKTEVNNGPGESALEITKVIKKLGGVKFENQNYNSGDELVYEIQVKNTGSGMATDVSIVDKISELKVEVAGGTLENALTSWTVASIATKPTTTITPSSVAANTDINLLADIDVNDTITITITGTINSKAVGTIPKNIVTVQKVEKETPEINPEKGELSFVKGIEKGENYTQGGTIEYKLTITNLSKTYVNDVSIIDEISKIKATALNEDSINAFESWTVTRSDKGTGTTYTQLPSLTNADINDKIDISPSDIIVYTVKGIVKDNIVGNIVNIGYVEYVGPNGVVIDEETVISKTIPGSVRITKEPLSPTYLPNGQIGFKVVLTNISKTNVANNITVKDVISGIVADKVGGGVIPAFKPGWEIIPTIEGDTVNSNISNLVSLEDGKDILDVVVDLGKDTKIIIEIRGFAESNIYGDIKNIASFSYPDAKETYEERAVIKNEESTPELTKVVDKLEYNSGETLEYTIKIKNTGKSVIPNFILTDEIGKIKGEVSGENMPEELAFESWERISLTVPATSALLEETGKNSIEGDTYKAILDLGPGDEVVLKLSALTKNNVFGTLINTAVGKYTVVGENGPIVKELKAPATSTGEIGVLSLAKTVKTKTLLEGTSAYLYAPGEEIEYKIVVTNNSDGWVRNSMLEDKFSEITTKLFPTGELGPAFQNDSITIEYTSTSDENSVIIIKDKPNLEAKIDIEAKSSITFTVKIKVSNDAVSMIENKTILTMEDEKSIDAKARVFAKIPDVNLEKKVNLKEFEGSQKMIYTIILENIGENNLVGIEGRDILSEIRSMNNLGEMVYPFETGAIVTKVIEPANSVIITPTTTEEGNVVDTLDMRPKSKITYTIELKIKNTIVGSITNIAKARIRSQDGFGNEKNLQSEVVSNPGRPTIGIEKTVVTSIEGDAAVINGEEVTYTVKIKTDAPVFNVKMIDEVINLKTEAGAAVFVPESIKLVSVQEAGVEVPYTGNINGTTSQIEISAITNEVVIVIKATVKKNVSLKSGEKIKNIASANFDQTRDGVSDLETDIKAEVDISPKAPSLEITKVAKQDEILLGEEVEYTIKVKNVGTTLATNFTIVDNISEMTELSNNGTKIPAYTSWTIEGNTGPNSKLGTFGEVNENLNIKDAEIAEGETLTYTIKAKTSLNLKAEKIRNTAKLVILGLNDIEAKAEVKVKKPLVSIDKEAGVRETSVGKFVPYSLVITNNENQPIKQLYVKDTPPAGFKLVDGSLQIVRNGEKVGTIPTTYEGNVIKIGPFNLEAKEQIEVVYLTKVSIGVVRGVYKNVALVTNTSGKPVSNTDAAEVDVV